MNGPVLQLRLVQFDRGFLDKSWEWLNDTEVRELTMTPLFSKYDQLKWYQSLEQKTDYYIWGITCNNLPIGVCGIKNISDKSGEYWGYIGEKLYWGLGIGKWIMTSMKNEAIALGLSQLVLSVNISNKRAINLYKDSGFIADRVVDSVLNMYIQL